MGFGKRNKKVRYKLLVLVTAVGLSFLAYCKRDGGSYGAAATDGIPQPANNLINPERVNLGKMLFFDPILSGSNWISCSTCHNPSLGWSDGLPRAIGTGMQVLGRHTPTIIESAFSPLQFWDGRAESLEEQAAGPITAPGEMNQNFKELVEELKAIEGYRELFEKAYPGQGITQNTITMALASFQRTIVSRNSPYDRYQAGQEDALNASAKRGLELFNGKARCNLCHFNDSFTDDGFHNIGIKSELNDGGRYAVLTKLIPSNLNITPPKINMGAFKTPTLRDIALTAPYMHDGSYQTLMEVVEHYVRGGDDKSNLDPNIEPLELNHQEKEDLVEFMLALTGETAQVEVPKLPRQTAMKLIPSN